MLARRLTPEGRTHYEQRSHSEVERRGAHGRRWDRRAANGPEFSDGGAGEPTTRGVAFAGEGCGPWYLLAPEIAAIEEAFRGRVTVATLDVEAQPQTLERHGVGTLPAVLFFQDGRVVDQLSGW
jgi:thiol-disulfide isomerase/thioredoxin